MREESHLEEMRSAIRGDFARLAERRGDQELMQVGAEPESEIEPEPELDPALELVRDEAEVETATASTDAAEEEQEPRSWLARLLSR